MGILLYASTGFHGNSNGGCINFHNHDYGKIFSAISTPIYDKYYQIFWLSCITIVSQSTYYAYTSSYNNATLGFGFYVNHSTGKTSHTYKFEVVNANGAGTFKMYSIEMNI